MTSLLLPFVSFAIQTQIGQSAYGDPPGSASRQAGHETTGGGGGAGPPNIHMDPGCQSGNEPPEFLKCQVPSGHENGGPEQ
jgi:hypothetical protein